MYHKIIIFSLAMVVCFAALAMADGGFFGNVGYGSGDGCSFTLGDMVKVLNTDTGESYTYAISQHGPSYDTRLSTEHATWPPGHYRLWVSKYQDGQCGPAVLAIVTHG